MVVERLVGMELEEENSDLACICIDFLDCWESGRSFVDMCRIVCLNVHINLRG